MIMDFGFHDEFHLVQHAFKGVSTAEADSL